MTKCLTCNDKEAKVKFCSRSCAASYNNRGVRRHGKDPNNICFVCGKKTQNPKYCSLKCKIDVEHANRIEKWKRDGIYTKSIKRYLLEINDGCWCCGIKEWNKKPIILELEHIDGNSENNKEDNLSLLCPNCHSQTDTYKGKNAGNGRYKRRQRYKQGKSY